MLKHAKIKGSRWKWWKVILGGWDWVGVHGFAHDFLIFPVSSAFGTSCTTGDSSGSGAARLKRFGAGSGRSGSGSSVTLRKMESPRAFWGKWKNDEKLLRRRTGFVKMCRKCRPKLCTMEIQGADNGKRGDPLVETKRGVLSHGSPYRISSKLYQGSRIPLSEWLITMLTDYQANCLYEICWSILTRVIKLNPLKSAFFVAKFWWFIPYCASCVPADHTRALTLVPASLTSGMSCPYYVYIYIFVYLFIHYSFVSLFIYQCI